MKRQTYHRRQLIKDMLVLQLKLGLDALRDLVLSPVALVCVIVDLVRGSDKDSSLFYRLMRVGALSDRWINVFGQHDGHAHPTVDDWVDQAERQLRQRNEKRN